MMDRESEGSLRVAIIGAGYMAREHIRAFSSIRGIEIAGIYSRTRLRAEALAAEFGISSICDSITELYEATRAELVVVAIPELEMHKVAVACFGFTWTVLLEKPAGYNYEVGVEIASAARTHGAKVFVALNRRHYSSTRRVLAALSENSVPRFIKVQDQEDPAQALAGGQPALVVSNWMYANSIHLIDFFRVFGRGRIVSVNLVVPWEAL